MKRLAAPGKWRRSLEGRDCQGMCRSIGEHGERLAFPADKINE
jgi:hypothetical protein